MSASRQQLSQREIDAVLKHYRVGAIKDIRELPEGSVYSPKVILETERGTLLLKRRARGLDLPALVAFGHEVVLGCMAQGLCIPPLLATEDDANSMVQYNDHVYELFVFIHGERFSPSRPSHAREMGALLHETYDAMDRVSTSFEAATEPETIDLNRLAPLAPNAESLPGGMIDEFTRIMTYGQELAKANAQRPALVHGDWHPGNMIFRGETLVAVCDFDNTRIGSRDRELAQALIHASLIAPQPGQTAAVVPPEPARDRLSAFWEGYTRAGGRAQARTIAGLMPAVMIDEALASLGAGLNEQRLSLLTAVQRKAGWLDHNQQQLIELLNA